LADRRRLASDAGQGREDYAAQRIRRNDRTG
jgi:hypothetical protein